MERGAEDVYKEQVYKDDTKRRYTERGDATMKGYHRCLLTGRSWRQ